MVQGMTKKFSQNDKNFHKMTKKLQNFDKNNKIDCKFLFETIKKN